MSAVADHPGGRIPQIVAGPASIDRLADPALRFGARRAVLVLDEAVVTNGYDARLHDALESLDDVRIHVVPPFEPTAASVDAAADVVRASGSPVVIGVGGGTALDTAKHAAVVAGACHGVMHYALGAHPLPAGGPIVAVPTTAGTGAEVTRTCVLTDAGGRKVWTWGDELLPDLVVLDPVASATMPPHITATTGLDAFVHAIEAVTGRRRNALVTAPGVHAMRLVLDHLPGAVRDGRDLDIRMSMQEAALLAGIAIDGGGTGIAHSIGHALGTLAHLPHGVTVAIGLAAALPWNIEAADGVFEPVANAIGTRVGDLTDVYSALLTAVGFAAVVARFGELAVSPGELAAAMVAPENVPMYENNCRRADDAERLQLAERTLQLWDGWRLSA